MTTEHRDKFRFSYLIIAHCSTFSKDKLHYYYASFFWHLLLLTVHTWPITTTNTNTLCHMSMSLCVTLLSASPNLSWWLKGILFCLLNLMRELVLFWHFCTLNRNVICKKKNDNSSTDISVVTTSCYTKSYWWTQVLCFSYLLKTRTACASE